MMKSLTATSIAMIATAMLAAGQPATASTPPAASLSKPFSPCRLSDPMRLSALPAQCAEISVLESDAPGSRRITLSVARIPAINSAKRTDAIVLLAGGPGQGAQLAYTVVSRTFARAGRERDILLIDQRGTGRSNLLDCSVETRTMSEALAADTAAFVEVNERCLTRLRKSNDLAAYTTSHAVRDLEAIRALLGYESFNLYAASYGTRVAQHFARRYPERVRSMVLDGVVAPQTVLGPKISLDAQAALEGIWDRCHNDESCRKTFGDMRQKTADLQARLKQKAEPVQIPNPRTAVMESFNFGPEQLAAVLRFGSYDPNVAAMLPLVVSEAASGNLRPVSTLFLLTVSSVQEMIALGMHNSVVCSEDVPRFDAVSIDRTAVAASYLGTGFLDALPRICAEWPRGLVDPDFAQPLVSDVPTLLLSGSLDPVTPPADANRVAQDLKNSRHLIFSGAGHGQTGIACMDRVLSDFYTNVDPKGLDTKCLDRRIQPPFWLSSAGPSP